MKDECKNCVIAICIWFAIPFIGLSHAVENHPGKTQGLDTIEKLQQKINQINNRLTTISTVKSDQVALEFRVTIEDIEKRQLDLRMLRSAHERLLYSISAFDKVEKEVLFIKEQYEKNKAQGMIKEPPYTLTFLDRIHDEQLNIERNQQNIASTIEVIRQEITGGNDRLQILEKEIRKINETLSKIGGEGQKTLRWKNDTLKIQLNELQTIIRAKENEIRRYETEKKVTVLQIALLKDQTDFVRSNLAFDPEDLNNQLASVQERRKEIQKEMGRLWTEQKGIETKWLKAQQESEKVMSPDERELAGSYLKSRAEWKKTYQVALELNEQAMLLIERQAMVWRTRYALVKGKLKLEKLNTLRDETKNNLESTGKILQIQQNYLANLQNQITANEAQSHQDNVLPAIRQNLSIQLDAARKRLERRLAYQSVILSTHSIENRLLNEIETQLGQSTVQDHLSGIKKDIVDFWNIEIWTVDNQPVTLRKVAVALVILLLGMAVAKYSLFIIRTRFLMKSQFQETTASAVHKLMSYTAYLLVFLFALQMVNIPLTAFAFLGGAVAIGIGFGAQNLINNFISGFMILGERPINIGDLIEVEGVLGMVEEIGARCTRVRTGENIHILVPNSTFLEKNITNWTHSNKKIRTNVTVGVTYGSSVQTVQEKLIESVKAMPRVLKHPKPFVLFSDFGDNALIFNVYFWIEIMRIIERREIESNVRFKIDELFTEQGLVIAFPQRDVHLDTLKPLQISIDHSEKKM